MAEAPGPAHDPMIAICPWCSAALTPNATTCPSCGASLVSDGDANVPGLTTVHAPAIVAPKALSAPRNRLLSWISGEYPADIPSEAEVAAIAPPPLEVRREMLRIELEAEMANLNAEANAIAADAAVEGQPIELPEALTAEQTGDAGEAGDAAEAAADVAVPPGEDQPPA